MKALVRIRWMPVIAFVAAAGLPFLAGCTAKPSTRTPGGTLQRLLKSAKARDAEAMKAYCVDMAAKQCDQLLAAIAEMENAGKASRFDSWNASAGPTPAGSRANAYADLFGVNHDLFMRVSVTLQRVDDKNWKIDQIAWESKRQE